jgi:uncharacterized protein YcgL (UPF0745 family)
MANQRCVVYKSVRKADAYLYVVEADDFAAVPATLLEMLGRLEYVMDLWLTPERKLARADADEVRDALSSQAITCNCRPTACSTERASAPEHSGCIDSGA